MRERVIIGGVTGEEEKVDWISYWIEEIAQSRSRFIFTTVFVERTFSTCTTLWRSWVSSTPLGDPEYEIFKRDSWHCWQTLIQKLQKIIKLQLFSLLVRFAAWRLFCPADCHTQLTSKSGRRKREEDYINIRKYSQTPLPLCSLKLNPVPFCFSFQQFFHNALSLIMKIYYKISVKAYWFVYLYSVWSNNKIMYCVFLHASKRIPMHVMSFTMPEKWKMLFLK